MCIFLPRCVFKGSDQLTSLVLTDGEVGSDPLTVELKAFYLHVPIRPGAETCSGVEKCNKKREEVPQFNGY